jgi:aryl-alcohol dehydrogenase-like predicted oxidoreductase
MLDVPGLVSGARSGLKRFVSETSPYSIFVRAIELDVLPAVQHFGMGLLAWSPLNGGWLSGKYRQGAPAPEQSRATLVQGQWGDHYPILRTRFDLSRPGNQRKLEIVEQLSPVAERAGMTLAHMALAFPLVHPGVTAVNFGVRTLKQFEEVKAGFGTRLSSDVLDAIDACNPPGSIVDEADRGWPLPWLAPEARRRATSSVPA